MNYQKICSDLLGDLPQRAVDVIERRFGLKSGKRETLEAIGVIYGITRERVRQIENEGFSKIKPELKQNQSVNKHFQKVFASFGGVKKEEDLINIIGKDKNCALFLLTCLSGFERVPEDTDFHAYWATDKSSITRAQKTIRATIAKLNNQKKTLKLASNSYIDISKKIQKGSNGNYGLSHWIEINPKGIKDRAYLVLRGQAKPIHFTEVASMIGNNTHVATVHNELIKDSRFVLVGRGLYALKEWGYERGIVRDVIAKTIKDSKRALSKEEILTKVSKQRFVKENTIALNLQNRNYFLRNSQGRYTIKEG